MAVSIGTGDFHVALLRAVNVDGKKRLPMKELATIFLEAGAVDVQTYIQSGNVVFRAVPALAERLSSLVAEAILNRFEFEVPVVTRSAEEFRRVASGNPFLADGIDTTKLHVVFLTARPDATRADTLDPGPSSSDEFEM